MLMDLNPGDSIQLAQDEDEPSNWFVSKDVDGFQLRGKDFDKIGQLTFNHKGLNISFVESFELPTDKTHSFQIAQEATIFEESKYFGILVTE